VVLLFVLTSCGGGGSPQLIDGSRSADAPAALAGLDGAVMTRVRAVPAGELAVRRLRACGLLRGGEHTTVVERVGLAATSLTARVRSSLNACDGILHPVPDPDRPYGGIWCGSSVGRLAHAKLNDPRLDLCTAEDGEITAFVWVEPLPRAKWVVVKTGGVREVYEVSSSLPVRVTTTESVRQEGSASFDIEEYAAEGRKLRAYTLDASVAG
jgi:hypothetical protein